MSGETDLECKRVYVQILFLKKIKQTKENEKHEWYWHTFNISEIKS